MEVEPVDEPKKNTLRNSPANQSASALHSPAEGAQFAEEKKRGASSIDGSKSQRTGEEDSK